MAWRQGEYVQVDQAADRSLFYPKIQVKESEIRISYFSSCLELQIRKTQQVTSKTNKPFNQSTNVTPFIRVDVKGEGDDEITNGRNISKRPGLFTRQKTYVPRHMAPSK